MTDSNVRKLPGGLALLAARPRLAISILIGLVAGVGSTLLISSMRPSTGLIVGWDALSISFLISIGLSMLSHGPDEIRVQAAKDDEGRGAILALVLIAVATSIGAVGAELSLAKEAHGVMRFAHISLAFGTVAASWTMVQVIFALHYAHEYYTVDPASGTDCGGLAFPGGEPPDYWDFLHFSTVIGVAGQTADIAFTSKTLRRLGTIHGLIAFAFNTVIVALTINLLAGLF